MDQHVSWDRRPFGDGKAVHPSKGVVYIVGAGPGDPGLLTIKAHKLITSSDVVVYDRLVSKQVLDLVPVGVPRIYAGKMPGRCHMPQEDTNRLLEKLSRTNHRVVRLKGGDPFMFGRGGEEALYLANQDIPFEVVPGVTAAAACSAYANIPLTHRGLANAVHVVTGHSGGTGKTPSLCWQALADSNATLVIYMGLANAEKIMRKLIEAGLPADTPTAVIERGTTPQQRNFITTLHLLPDIVVQQQIKPPAIIIIGHVVSLAEVLQPVAKWDRSLAQTSLEVGQNV